MNTEVQDDFHSKEVTTYQNMRHLVNDVKYVQQHILKLYDLLRQISGNVCDAFPPGGPVGVATTATACLPGPNDADTYAFNGPGSDAHYSDQLPQRESRPLDGSDAHIIEGGNQVCPSCHDALAAFLLEPALAKQYWGIFSSFIVAHVHLAFSQVHYNKLADVSIVLQIDGPHPYGNMDRYGERHEVAVNQSTYNPV
jgi:hypothetical protein